MNFLQFFVLPPNFLFFGAQHAGTMSILTDNAITQLLDKTTHINVVVLEIRKIGIDGNFCNMFTYDGKDEYAYEVEIADNEQSVIAVLDPKNNKLIFQNIIHRGSIIRITSTHVVMNEKQTGVHKPIIYIVELDRLMTNNHAIVVKNESLLRVEKVYTNHL